MRVGRRSMNIAGIPNLEAVLDILRLRKGRITEEWVRRSEVADVLSHFHIEPDWFLDHFGNQILGTFIRIIEGKQPPGECPYMNRMVRFLKEKDMTVTDVFTVCTGLRRSVRESLFSESDKDAALLMQNVDKAALCNEMANIFDMNLMGVLRIFQETISQKDKRIEQYMQIVDKNVIISKTDLRGVLIDVSQAFCEASGYSRKELIGRPHNIVRHPDMSPEFFKDLWTVIQDGKTWYGEIKNRRKDGSAYWVEGSIQPLEDRDGNLYGYMAIRHDITHTIMMFTDPLTRIHNRLKFEECIETEISRYRRYGQEFCIILFDIDDFKKVNDTHGHRKGDEVLIGVTSAVKGVIRGTDIFARWGGEEFVILAFGGLEEAQFQAERLRSAVENAPLLEDRKITCSFGVALFRPHDTESSVFARADSYLYKAKASGKNCVISDLILNGPVNFQI